MCRCCTELLEAKDTGASMYMWAAAHAPFHGGEEAGEDQDLYGQKASGPQEDEGHQRAVAPAEPALQSTVVLGMDGWSGMWAFVCMMHGCM